jgi:hypothetical protein
MTVKNYGITLISPDCNFWAVSLIRLKKERDIGIDHVIWDRNEQDRKRQAGEVLPVPDILIDGQENIKMPCDESRQFTVFDSTPTRFRNGRTLCPGKAFLIPA